MGVYFVMSPCYNCKQIFSYNPHLVPSLPASVTSTGEKEPVCLTCVEIANPERVKRGLAEIVPLPGAYEPAEE